MTSKTDEKNTEVEVVESDLTASPIVPDDSELLSASAYEGETEDAKAKRQKALREAYTAAEKRLKEENLDRFNVLNKQEAAARGYSWSPRLTKEQKAEAALEKLLTEFPHLRNSSVAGG
jgi:hypothetical protein